MKKLMKYLKPYWFLTILAPLFMIGEVVLDLVQPQLMAKIVDNGILNELLSGSEKIKIVLVDGLFMLLALALGGFCGIMSGVCASSASNAFGNDLRKDVFSSVVNLSFEQTDKFTTGSLVTRITNDITQVQDFIAMAIRMFIRTLVMFIGGIIFMFLTSYKFAIILAVVMPFEIVILFIALRKSLPFFKAVQEKVDNVNTIVQENVNGVRVVKAYTQEDYESGRFDKANSELSDVNIKVHKILALLHPFMTILLNGVIIAIIYFGGLEIAKNASSILSGSGDYITVGKLMSGLEYVGMVLMSIMGLVMVSQSLSRAQISAKRICEVLDSIPVVNSGNGVNPTETGSVEFKDVSFSYPNYSDKLVIDNFNLKVNKGEKIAILGATGSGKSTIVNLIPRFYDTTNGVVLVDNCDVKEYKLEELRDKISIVLQRTELFGGTIEDNIKWGNKEASLDDVINCCKVSQANDFITSFKDGYNTIVGERGTSLSGGQKQRIAIARALIKKPEILIFDDSTSALDLKTEANLYNELKKNYKDTTIILIAQRVASARNADRIAIINEGKLVSFDTHDNLIKNCPIYQDIYNSQLKRGDINE